MSSKIHKKGAKIDALLDNLDNLEPKASSSNDGFMSAADKGKLDGLPNAQQLVGALAEKQDVIPDLATIRSGAGAGATAYQKPGTGIPESDMSDGVKAKLAKAETALQEHQDISGKQDVIDDLSTIRSGAAAGGTAYQKPGTGIPESDLSDAVKAKLAKAETALQEHQDISGKQDVIDDLSTIRSGAAAGGTAYQKPGTGIPASDLSSEVQDMIENGGKTKSVSVNGGTPVTPDANGLVDLTIEQANVTIGTVTTGPAGSDAEVHNSGTGTAPVLDFVIPKGDDGGVGPQGPQGDSAVYNPSSPDTPDFVMANTPGQSTTKAMTQKAVTDELDAINDVLHERFGDFFLPAVTTSDAAVTGKYVANGGGINNSSTGTMTVAWYLIPEGYNIDKVRVVIPKTGNSAAKNVSGANTTSQTSVTVLAGTGNAGAYDSVVNLTSAFKYIVVCYNSAGGNPSVYFHVDKIKGIEGLFTNFSLVLGAEKCIFKGSYIKDGAPYSFGGFSFSPHMRIYGAKSAILTASWTSSSAQLVAFYDESGTYISGVLAKSQSSVKVTIPSNAAFIRMSSKDGETESVELISDGIDGFKSDLSYSLREEEKFLNILHLGNSFTANAHENIDEIINAIGRNGYDININYINNGGYSLSDYVQAYKSGTSMSVGTSYSHKICGGSLTSIFKANWDVVVFQQVSSDADNYNSYVPNLALLANAVRSLCPNKNVKVAFMMTWGVSDATYANIVNAVKQMRDNFDGVDIIIPAGTALENARNTTMNESNFATDGRHLAHGVGEYVAGCAFYQAVIAPVTGLPITKDTTTLVTTSGGTGEVAVTAENRALCQKCAEYAVIHPFGSIDVESL